jgi:hypothetical protein
VQGNDSLNVSIAGTAGGNYEALSLAGTVATTVTDDATGTTVTLSSASAASVSEGGSVVYTASVNNAVTGADLVVTLSNGQTVTIPVGQSTASVTYTVRADDPYVQGNDSLNVSIAGTAGGNYEALSLAGTVATTVTDDATGTTVTLSATSTVVEGAAITYTASVASPVTGSDVVVTLSNGAQITIPVGQSTGTASVATPANSGGSSLTATIVTAAGGGYEDLQASALSATTTVTDVPTQPAPVAALPPTVAPATLPASPPAAGSQPIIIPAPVLPAAGADTPGLPGGGDAAPSQWNIDPTIPASNLAGATAGTGPSVSPATVAAGPFAPGAAADVAALVNSLPAPAAIRGADQFLGGNIAAAQRANSNFAEIEKLSNSLASRAAASDQLGIADKLYAARNFDGDAGRVEPGLRGFDAIRLPDDDRAVARNAEMMGGTGYRLFVYKGIATGYLGDAASDVFRVPTDAFAHTDPTAVILLEARLASGAPLPSWLSFDGASGQFSGVPPQGMRGEIDLEVTAKDTEGRVAKVNFRLVVGEVRITSADAAPDAKNPELGLSVDKAVADKLLHQKESEKAKPAPAKGQHPGKTVPDDKSALRGSPPFSEQLVVAKANQDPLLDRIVHPKGE